MRLNTEDPIEELTLDFAERYCCENADELIAPSQHILDWAVSERWQIRASTRVLHNCYLPNHDSQPSVPPQLDHVLFFGRLETRKGLGVFLEGLQLHNQSDYQPKIKEVTFLGRTGQLQGRPAKQVLLEWQKKLPEITFHLELEHDTHAAIRHIRQSGAITFLPSLLDNCPLAIIECIENKIPFLAANSGGIPEIVDTRNLFQPNAEGIAQALREMPNRDWNASHPYSATRQNQAWIDLHSEPGPLIRTADKPTLKMDQKSDRSSSKISVCIPYYNLHEYLPQTLRSLSNCNEPNLQVIVCDDGSTHPKARQVFKEQEQLYVGCGWVFVTQVNHGVGPARNRAAAEADGDYLVFMDADNLARPEMLTTMHRAMETSGADALSCYFTAFYSNTTPDEKTRPHFIYRPLGAVHLLGLMENTYGDANCIIKRSVFDAIGGFRGDPIAACADWDLFLRLHLSGYSVDVIPRELFWYRHRPNSMLRTARTEHEHHHLVASALMEHPNLVGELIQDVTLPLYQQLKNVEERVGRNEFGRLKKAPAPWHKHIYRWYRRMLGDPRYRKSLTR